jgi:hypothetical protein
MTSKANPAEINRLERQLDEIVAEMLAVSVFSNEYDVLTSRYRKVSFRLCVLSGEINTCDTISY